MLQLGGLAALSLVTRASLARMATPARALDAQPHALCSLKSLGAEPIGAAAADSIVGAVSKAVPVEEELRQRMATTSRGVGAPADPSSVLAGSTPAVSSVPIASICGAAAVAADRQSTRFSRRTLLRGASWAAGMHCGGALSRASAYGVNQVKPDERETYAKAQEGRGPLRVLWVGPGSLKGVFKGLFRAGNEVVAVDLVRPDGSDLSAATAYATEHGYRLRFEQGDATRLAFADGAFDVVVCSMFLCQDFDPAVVVSEIRRVLRQYLPCLTLPHGPLPHLPFPPLFFPSLACPQARRALRLL